MSKQMKSTGMFCLLVLSLSLPVQAAFIDGLEDLPLDGSLVNERLMDGVNVSFSSNTDGFYAASYGQISPYAYFGDGAYNTALNATADMQLGERLLTSWVQFGQYAEYRFDFSEQLSGFGFLTEDLMESSLQPMWMEMLALDAAGNTLDTQRRDGKQGDSGVILQWGVASANGDIDQVVFRGVIASGIAFGVDNFYLQSSGVPLPSSAALLFAALIWLKRCRT